MLYKWSLVQVHEVRLTPEQVDGATGPLLLKLASSLSYGPPTQDKVGSILLHMFFFFS